MAKIFKFKLKSESKGTDDKLIKNQKICFRMIIKDRFAHIEIFAALPHPVINMFDNIRCKLTVGVTTDPQDHQVKLHTTASHLVFLCESQKKL